MTTLVTGAGLIGTAFARYAFKRGEEIVFLDPEPRADFLRFKLGTSGYTLVRKDIRDLPGLIETITKHRITTVVHTAGLIGGRVQQSLSLAFDINLGGTRNVAEAIRLTDVRRLVHISTFGVYDSRVTPTAPITEDFPRGGVRGYGNLKIGKETLLEAYAHEYKRELFMLRPANVYGFGHFFAGSSGGQKMQALLEAGLKGSTASIPSSETMSNEYVYADDVGRAVDLAATVEAGSHRTFNIGNGVITAFEELIATVKKIAPLLKYHIEPGAAPSSKAFPLDISRAEASLHWRPCFSLAEGFADFRDEVEKARSAGY